MLEKAFEYIKRLFEYLINLKIERGINLEHWYMMRVGREGTLRSRYSHARARVTYKMSVNFTQVSSPFSGDMEGFA